MEVRLLGPIEAGSGDRQALITRRQERLLLAILALEAGRMVPSGRLASLLWPDGPPDGARQTLQTCISRLRTALKDIGAHDSIIERRDGGYRINVQRADVDVHRFDDMVRSALADPSVARRAAVLRAALALWRGPALGDVSLHPAQIALRTGLDERRRAALLDRITADLALGRAADLIAEILAALDEATTTEEPIDERLIALLMRAYAASGRRDEALQLFHVARGRLADELGLDPGPDLTAVHIAILRNEAPPSGIAALPVPSQLPRPIDPFMGREAELTALHELRRRRNETGAGGPVVIDGPGGVGKTALAVRFAYEVVDEFPDGRLFVGLNGYAGGTEPTDPRAALREMLGAFGVEDPPAELSALTGLYRSTLSGRRVLVVLDNARSAEQVRPLLPHAVGCMVLVTSRSHLTGLAVMDSSAAVSLAVMNDHDAARLLTTRLGAARTRAEPEALGQLIRVCAGLPLALSVVAARATAKPAFPLLAFADEVDRPNRLLSAFASEDLGSDLQTVLSWSYDQLSPAAGTTFRLLGIPGGSRISIEAVESLTGAGRTPTVRTLREMEEANLVDEESPGRFAIHDLLKAYATGLALADAAAQGEAVRRLLSHYLHTALAAALLVFPERPRGQLPDMEPGVAVPALPDRSAALEWFGRETAALTAAVDIATDYHQDSMVISLVDLISDYLFRAGNWREAIAIQRAAAAAAGRGGDMTRRGVALRTIGNALVQLDDHDDAMTHFRMALACFEHDADPALAASAHLGMSKAANAQGHLEDSLQHALDALSLYRSAGNKRTICRGLNTVGYCYALVGDYAAALEFCTEALELSRAVDDPHSLAGIWDSLGHAHRGLGDFNAARDSFHKAIDMYATLDDSYKQGETLMHLGDSEEAAGRPEAAELYWRQAVEHFDRLRHPAAGRLRARLSATGSS